MQLNNGMHGMLVCYKTVTYDWSVNRKLLIIWKIISTIMSLSSVSFMACTTGMYSATRSEQPPQ